MPQSQPLGVLRIVGLGPGDPELMTLKAARRIAEAEVIAFFAKAGRPGRARAIVEGRLHPTVEELRLDYPFTTEVSLQDPRYLIEIAAFYDACADRIAERLQAGRDVVLLCEGDPFFYGSSMYLFDRLAGDYAHEVVPGVTGMSGCWTQARAPICHGDDVLVVLPGVLDEEVLVQRLKDCDAAVIMKVGRNLAKVRRALDRAGLLERAICVQSGTLADEVIGPVAAMDAAAPYFSTILAPGRRRPR